MKNTHKINTLLVIVTVFILASSVLLANNAICFDSVTDPSRNNSFIHSAITVDGSLSTGEWDDAAYVEEWYMDADEENTDGYNYMYLNEDADNLYIGLDLCSDTTNNGTGEWVGVWLNTNQAQFFNESYQEPTEWEALLNQGTESLIYDVENERLMPFFDEDGYSMGYYISPEYWYVVNGSSSSTYDELTSNDDVYYNITSEYNGTHYITRIDYHINFYDYFVIFEDIFVDHLLRVTFGERSLHNVTVAEHFVSISDLDGNLNPLSRFDLGTGTTETASYTTIDSEYFTNENETIISVTSVNDAPFNSSYDRLNVGIEFNWTTIIGADSVYPYSTIQTYDIAWGFGPSQNNATDHRQFEIKIPKTELEGYETDTDLGIIVGGYGTLISFPNTHNWVFANGTNLEIPEQSSIYYNYYTMPLKGQVITTPTSTTGTTSATSTSTTTSPIGGGEIDPSLYLIIGGVGAFGVVVVIILIMVRKK